MDNFGQAIILLETLKIYITTLRNHNRCTALERVGWLVGCFGFNGPLRQCFSLNRAVSQREGDRGEKG